MNKEISWPGILAVMGFLLLAQFVSFFATLGLFKLHLLSDFGPGLPESAMIVQFVILNLGYIAVLYILPRTLGFSWEKQGTRPRWYLWFFILAAGFSYQIVGTELENNIATYTGRDLDSVEMIGKIATMQGVGGFLLASFFLAVCPPVFEELFFRHIIQNGLGRRYGLNMALIVSSAIFAVVHWNLSTIPSIFLLSLVLGMLYHDYGLLPAMALHASVNFSVVVFSRLEVPLPGLNTDGSVSRDPMGSGLLLFACAVFGGSVFALFGKYRKAKS